MNDCKRYRIPAHSKRWYDDEQREIIELDKSMPRYEEINLILQCEIEVNNYLKKRGVRCETIAFEI